MSEIPGVDYTLEYPYTRTTGPVIGPFLTGLRDGRLLGIRCGERVLCPPTEYDPDTGATLEPDMVSVGPGGEVRSVTWIPKPSTKHPFDEPFAFAQILLDGADTTLVHAVRAHSAADVAVGSRVQPQFRDDRRGAITDVFFVPEAEALEQAIEPGDEPVEITQHLIGVRIREELHPHRHRFVEGLLAGKLLGQRSPVDGRVYIPSRGYDNLNRVLMDDTDVEVADVGTVVAFTEITPVQYHGQLETEPYIRASVLFDGASQPITGIDIRDIPLDEFRVGLRVRCVWKPPDERRLDDVDNRYGSLPESVYARFEPTGEPDVDPVTLREHSW